MSTIFDFLCSSVARSPITPNPLNVRAIGLKGKTEDRDPASVDIADSLLSLQLYTLD